ncbi:DUF6483 family protein [Clostridium tunisiense]|uniref:DUF6483 family protein n=1 Tax=Clostridium tunisiense TaxID=219748 RepID=UPI0003044D7C|nr:DUF6483 family protein [Clostridium tunisiense]
MNIERMIENLAKNLAKTVLNKKEKSNEKINLNQLGSTDILQIMLNRLVHEGNYNKAENILFEEINKKDSEVIYKIAMEFYNSLLEKSDKELQEGNFTRAEIYQGLEDVRSIFEK